MEAILSKIIIEAQSKKITNLQDVAQHAYDCILASQGDEYKEIHVLREKCLNALEQAIDSKGKLPQLGIDGLHVLLRDNLFHSINATGEDENDTLPIQVLNTLHSLPNWYEDSSVQCHCLTVILQLMCSSSWNITCQAVTKSLDLCYGTYSSTKCVSVHMAARATVSQILQSYSSHLIQNSDVTSAGFNEKMKELLVFCCQKMKLMYSCKTPSPSLLLSVDSVLAILVCQNKEIQENEEFVNVIWQHLCPCLSEIMGWSPPKGDSSSPECSPKRELVKPIADMPDVLKSVYLVCGELLRLVGSVAGLRNVLEIVFEKVFLSTSVEHRADCLKCFKKFFSNPERIIDLFPLNGDPAKDFDVTKYGETTPNSNLSLWKIILDCTFECSRCKELPVVSASIDFVHTLLTSLLELCENEDIPISEKMILLSQETFPNLKTAEEEAFLYECDEKAVGFISKMYCLDNLSQSSQESESPVKQPLIEKDDTDDKEIDNSKEESVDECLNSLASRINERLSNVQAKISDQIPKIGKDKADYISEEYNAKQFVKSLRNEIPNWSELKSIIEVDESFQKFASNFVQNFMLDQEKNYETTDHGVLNGDAVYLTVFQSLRIAFACLKSEHSNSFCISEDTFCKEIVDSGCVVYVSEIWLRCVYKQIVGGNILKSLKLDQIEILPLHSIIMDFSGESCDLLWDVIRLQKATRTTGATSKRTVAAQKYCRRLVTGSWNGLQAIISNIILGLRHGASNNFQAWLRRKHKNESTSLVGEGLAASVSALHMLAKLCNVLKLQNRNGSILGQLVEVACPLEDLKKWTNFESKRHFWPLRASDALSMEIVIANAIHTGTHANECWKYILRCCEFVWELESCLFAEANDGKHKLVKGFQRKRYSKNEKAVDEADSVLLTSAHLHTSPSKTVADTLTICIDSNIILDSNTASKIVFLLVEKVDGFFESAARCLNLEALCELCNAMVSVSQDRLFYSNNPQSFHQTAFLIRLSRLMIELPKSSRPLSHLMRVWATVNAHFIEATCSDQLSTSSTALTCLHECVTGLLLEEFPTFSFNYSLVRPLQTTLCIDLCSMGVQDQVIGIIAELVEVHSGILLSGWKALFGALRALRASWDAQSQQSASIQQMYCTALNVLKVYLDNDDLNVFCLAANDCIMCLLKYLQTTEFVQDDTFELSSPDDNDESCNLCAPALTLLQRLHTTMVTLWNKSDVQSAQLEHRLSLRERSPQTLDRQFVRETLPSLHCIMEERGFFGASSANRGEWLEHDSNDKPLPPPWIGMANSQRAVLELWLSLLEGTVSSVSTCPRGLQPQALNTLHIFMTQLLQQPGVDFGSYCMVHLLLPMLENWMRREARYASGWRENSPSVSNFKQAIGLTSDLVLQYLKAQTNSSIRDRLLKDILYLLTECISQNSEVVSRLGCSSIRHLILECGEQLTEGGWYIVCRALWRAVSFTLTPLRLVMVHFEANSHQYYGDYGKVQVALRKDSNPREATRVRLLAQQVFLLDSQKFSENLEEQPDSLSQSHRSIILLLSDEKTSTEPNRLAFRDVVVSLISHQLLLKLIGNILLDGCKLRVSGVASLLLRDLLSGSGKEDKLSGYLGSLNGDHMHALLLCLESSFQMAQDFDDRPGLKFLFQKVFNSTVAANLYKQAVSSWTLRCVTLFELARTSDLPSKRIKELCETHDSQVTCFPAEAPVATCIDAALILLANGYMRVAKQLHNVETSVKKAAALEFLSLEEENEPVVFLLASPENNKQNDDVYILEKVTDEQENCVEPLHLDVNVEKDEEETVYDVASSETLANVLKEYKKRRNLASMPTSEQTKIVRRNPFERNPSQDTTFVKPDDGKDPQLVEEQKQARLKDGDARLMAWCEMGLCPLQLLLREDDATFIRLIPSVHPAVLQLTAGCTQQRVRLIVADYFHKITALFHILDQE